MLINACLVSALLCAQPLTPADPQPDAQPFPHLRVDRKARVVEFDAVVPIDARTPDAKGRHPLIYLELIACTPDTREHESLVVTSAKPSHIHAALLLIGLEPGKPGAWTTRNREAVLTPPTGDEVRVEFVTLDDEGKEHVSPAASWVRHAQTNDPLPDRLFLFAGSRIVQRPAGEIYDADMSGTLIGLATFGTETLALPTVFSPEAAVDEPVWIADPENTPPRGTSVRVRLTPANKQ